MSKQRISSSRVLSMEELIAKKQAERTVLAAAGVTWPPQLWQRVEIFGNRAHSDPPGHILGTLVHINGSYYDVVPDCIEPDSNYARECYNSELRPVLDDTAPGWLPYRFRHAYAHTPLHQPTATYDVQLRSGDTATECFAKQQPAGYYQFQEINRPYRCYDAQQVVALHPSLP